KTARRGNRDVVVVKTALQRPIVFIAIGLRGFSHVPLADGVGAVSSGAKNLCNGRTEAVEFDAIAVATFVIHHVANAGLMGIEAGEERGASPTAAGSTV